MKNDIKIKLQRAVEAFYEEAGRTFNASRPFAWPWMLDAAKKIQPGDQVVDVGAGNARFVDLVSKDASYLAIEPSKALRESAQKRLSERKNAEIRAGSFPKLDLPDAFADVVICSAVLHHLPGSKDREEAAQELYRILKPGGWLVCSAWNLRARRFFSLKSFLHAWLRIPGIAGAETGDFYYPWRENSVKAKRYVHALTLKEFKGLFAGKNWEEMKAGYHGKRKWTTVLDGVNLLFTGKKK